MAKILVIRFSSIGDIVLTSPVVRAIKQQLEGVELHVLVKENYAHLYQNDPNVDTVHSWGENYRKTLRELKKEQFDYIVDLHKNLRTFRVKLALRRKSFSFPKLNIRKWLLVKFKWDILPDIHIVDRYFKAVSTLGIHNDGKGLAFYSNVTKENLSRRFDFTKKYVVVAIGGQFETKKMPPSKLAEVLKGIPLRVVIIGGKEDRSAGEEIKKLLPSQPIENTCGKYSIHESARIIEGGEVLVTHDTGMMHIGAAYSLPIVSIWGNTVPEFGMYPYRPQNPDSFSIHQVEGLDCRPCSKIGYKKCPKGHFKCMLNQDTLAIRRKILSYLEATLERD